MFYIENIKQVKVKNRTQIHRISQLNIDTYIGTQNLVRDVGDEHFHWDWCCSPKCHTTVTHAPMQMFFFVTLIKEHYSDDPELRLCGPYLTTCECVFRS